MCLIKISLLLFCNLFIQISTSEPENTKTRKSNGHYEECVCFPAGQSLVSEVLSPTGHAQQRLVVFLYRNINTNQIKMFLPSPEKQPLIPNIPFEIGDVLKTITTESIASLFSTTPIYTPNNPGVPIGLKWGTIEHNINPNSNLADLLQVNPQQNIPQSVYLPNHKPDITVPNVPINQPNNNFLTTNRNVWETNSYQNNEAMNPLPKKTVLTDSVNVLTTRQEIYAPESFLTREQLTFDQWFNQQMAVFQDAKSPADIQSINTDVLRNLVQKTLHENHMHISSTGLITDSTGALINLNNLELRPILIGNSVTYQETLTADKQVALPKHLPYLEGIVITLVYPPKILGVIPLGKTYVSLNSQGSPPNALIEHYFNKPGPAPVATPIANKKDTTTSQQINPWAHSSPVAPSAPMYQTPSVPPNYNVLSSQFPNINSGFSAGGGVTYINGPQTNGIWKRRSNKSSKKQKAPKPTKEKDTPKVPKETKALKDAETLQKHKTKPMYHKTFSPSRADARNGRKSGSRFYENWQAPPPWEYNTAPQYSPYSIPVGGKSYPPVNSFGDPRNSGFTSSNFNPATYGNPNLASDPGQYWQPSSSLMASPYNEPKQNIYAIPYMISAQPINVNPSYENTKWISPPNLEWGPAIATTAYPRIDVSAIRSPYLRSEPPAKQLPANEKLPPFIVTTTNNAKPTTIKPKSVTTNVTAVQNQNNITGSVLNQEKPTGGTRRFPIPVIQGVIKTLINMVLQNLNPEVKSITLAPQNDPDSRAGNGATKESGSGGGREPSYDSSINISNHIEKAGEMDGDQPDFRIIGGSAATGSGSPLSNKGRSGADGA